MSKATGPLFSLGAHGTVGRTLTYQNNKNINVVRKMPLPKYTRNNCQDVRRQVFYDGANTWTNDPINVPESEKTVWNALAKGQGLTGFNLFMADYLRLNIDGCAKLLPPVIPHPYSFSVVSTDIFRPVLDSSVQWAKVTPAATNADNVKEVLHDDTGSYNNTGLNLSAIEDIFTKPTHAIRSGSVIDFVSLFGWFFTARPQPQGRLLLKSGANKQYGDYFSAAGGWLEKTKSWATNPFTGNNWQIGEINDLLFGYSGYGWYDELNDFTYKMNCTQIYLVIQSSYTYEK